MGKEDRVKARTRKNKKRSFHRKRFTIKLHSQEVESQQEPQSPSSIQERESLDLSPSGVVNDIERTSVRSINISQTKIKEIQTDSPKQSDIKITGYWILTLRSCLN